MKTAAFVASPINRPDTLLGVCHALGEDLGFDPLWLRLAFAGGLFWAPWMVIGAYLALAALIYLSRWMFPGVGTVASQKASEPELQQTDGDGQPDRLPMAA